MVVRAVAMAGAMAGAMLGLYSLGASAAPMRMMVVAANPMAARAGMDVLRDGGNAVDAAIAVQMVLGLVEPQSSGIGGGALLLYYNSSSHRVTYYDGRETAPAAATPTLFMGADGKPLGFWNAVLTGKSVGVPGTVAMLEMAYRDHGHFSWPVLFKPAIKLASDGFAVPPRLAMLAVADSERLHHQGTARDYLYPAGPLREGQVIKNPAYAATLRRIASDGASGLLRGPIAADIAAAVRADPAPGLLTAADLAAYKPERQPPVCGTYETYQVCGAGSPSYGGIAVLQTLGMLQRLGIGGVDPASPKAAMSLIEAERLAMADRDTFGGDSDFVDVPVAGLIAPDYLAARAKLIDPDHAMQTVQAGTPSAGDARPAQRPQPEHGTSDVAIVDGQGNAVSMTTTVEADFGSHTMVDGFFLNNELTDFAFLPTVDGKPVANRVQPGKRPRSSMAPVIVLDRQGKLVGVFGSAGGPRIPGYVLQAMVGALDWHLSPADSLALGHEGSSGRGGELEAGTPAAALAGALKQKGEPVLVSPMASGSAVILASPHGLVGAADPRRDGVTLGAP